MGLNGGDATQPWSNVDMPIERPYATSYLCMATAMFTSSVTVCEIYTVEMRMNLTLAFKMGQRKM